jgi:hypothetical protein
MSDVLNKIIAYEQGELDASDTIDLFQELGDSGLVFQLQVHYLRVYSDLAERGLIRAKGFDECDNDDPPNEYDDFDYEVLL